MKKIITLGAAAVALAAIATPANAAVSGGRIEAVVGYDSVSFDLGLGDDSTSGIVYGIGAGYDFAVGDKVGLGVDIEATDSTTEIEFTPTDRIFAGRDLYAGARLTAGLSDKANLYFKAGYTNARIKVETGGVTDAANAEGIRGGVGLQFLLGKSMYIGGEARYSNYEAGLERIQGVATLGFRF
jgi:outer membrane immunogenic protein